MIEQTSFAEINDKSVVQNVILASIEYINSLPNPSDYVQTWVDADGEKEKRYNYALIGDTYDSEAGAFIAPNPGNGFVLDTNTYKWVPSPVVLTMKTLDTAALRLAKITYLSVKTTNDMLTDESRLALTSYIAKISAIASTAQAALARGEKYAPEFPPEPTLNTNAPVFNSLGTPVVLQFKPDTVEK